MSIYNNLDGDATPLPNIYHLSWGELNTNEDDSARLDTITIRDILQSDSPNIFIFRNTHDRIVKMLNQPWQEDVAKQMPELLESMTVKQCEASFRWLMNDESENVAKRYQSFVSTGAYHISAMYGWLLPYFVSSNSLTKDLKGLPSIDKNLRPKSKDDYPHAFALHYLHQSLASLEDAYLNLTLDEVKQNYIPAHKKANQKRTDNYAKLDAKLREVYKDSASEFKKENAKSAAKQAQVLWELHGSTLGFEFSTLTKKVSQIKSNKQ